MKKKLSEAAIANELRQGSAFFRDATPPIADAEQEDRDSVSQLTNGPADEPTDHVTSRPVDQLISQSVDQSTNQSAAPRSLFDTSPILGRPKAFYITERQDRALDVAVEKLAERLRGRANQKIDRSTVVRLLLEVSDLTDDATADRLASQFVSRLVSQLTG